MKRSILLSAAMLAMAAAANPARGAVWVVDFDALAQGTLPVNFTSNSIDVVQLSYTDTVGNVCAPTHTGVSAVFTQAFPGCLVPSAPNQLVNRAIITEFDISDFQTQLGGSQVRKIVFSYTIMQGNVQIIFNGQCFTRASFLALPNGTYGGVRYSANNCRVRLRKKPNFITQFAVGGAFMAIDDVKARG